MKLPDDVPFGFIAIPQYATEAILRDELAMHGVQVQRGVRVTGFEQDFDGVTATLAGDTGEQTARSRYLVGADGAHSTVRKALGLTSEDAAFEEQYMLGDVEVDWSVPRGYGIRAMHQTNGTTDDVLVCIPLPGRNRYRMSMLAPDATGLTRDAVTGPLRQFSLLGGREHTTLLYGGENCGPADVEMFERAADKAITTARGHMDVYLIAAPSAGVAATVLPVVRDSHGEFAKAYSASEPSVFIVRPDGYLGFAAPGVHVDDLVTHQRAIFG